MTDVVANIAAPTFWRCAAPPQWPADFPAGGKTAVAQTVQKCGGGNAATSGFIMLVTFDDGKGGGPAGQFAVQNVAIKRTEQPCGGRPIPSAFNITEYFQVPAHDYHGWWLCCEEKDDVQASAQVAFLNLPANKPAIPAGENAAFINNAAVSKDVRDNYTLAWGYKYEYDGCHPAKPTTSCSSSQCIEIWTQTRTLGGLSPVSLKWVVGQRKTTNYSK
jgi:hypothetical protein